MQEYVSLGQLKKAHGVKGELKFYIRDKYIEDIENIEVFFLKVKGNLTPYFLEYLRFTNAPIIKFEDINSKEEASEIASLELFARQSDLISDEQRKKPVDDLQFSYLEGFTILDHEIGSVGTIEEVVEFPQQEMAVLVYDQREVLIPLNDALIETIDKEKKEVLMALPEGLLDL